MSLYNYLSDMSAIKEQGTLHSDALIHSKL